MAPRFNVLDVGAIFGYPVARILTPIGGFQTVFTDLGEITKNITTIDLVCFGGGQDIHPSIYHHKIYTLPCDTQISSRDLFEIEVWKLCQENKIPILGICRGAQFSCAMSGGVLIQDMAHASPENCGSEHEMETISGEKINMTSTHHQMMWPGKTLHKLIAWVESPGYYKTWSYDTSKLSLSKEDQQKEIEIVFFPKTRALAVQGHPEYYSDLTRPPVKYVQGLVEKYLLTKEYSNELV